jgi:GT2 family glycosyltransferase
MKGTTNVMAMRTAVVVCAHTKERLTLTMHCVESVMAGTLRPDEMYVVVDNNPELQADLTAKLSDQEVTVVANDGNGAADARTTALRRLLSDIVAFIDDDAWAEPDWLEKLTAPFARPDVVGVGGRILPDWEAGAVELPPELLWVVGSTYRGHPEEPVTITRPLGASMAARRQAMEAVGWFPHEFGPRGGKKASSNEELALFSRLRQQFGPDCLLYVPGAVVHHFAPASRTNWRYLVSRSWAEGVSKADIRRRFGRSVMGHDSAYLRQTLAPAIARGTARGIRRGDRQSMREAGMCVVALAVTGAGYVVRRAEHATGPARRNEDPARGEGL